ncbi:hypothetical protein BKA70DRAFT_1262263, partial [Coprinopsis sp. MPI-PUGE-AT-0042]
GGTFNNVGRDSHNHVYHMNCNVFVTGLCQIPHIGPASNGIAGSSGSSTHSCLPLRASASDGLSQLSLASPNPLPEELGRSIQLLLAEKTLLRIRQLVTPHNDRTGIYKRVAPCLAELEALIAFASNAYQACRGGTTMGRVIRTALDVRMEQCNDMLDRLLGELVQLPYRSFPRVGHAYRVVYEWWTGNEPEEIVAIRTAVSNEVIAIGECLHWLNSFWWASSQLLLANATFSMESLRAFLSSGPVSVLRGIHIEEIVFLEPLQGQRRSIPVRFVKTFEDIHVAVEIACRGTAASHFIEDRQYQLDNSSTNAVVDAVRILQCIEEYKELEVTILLPKLEAPANICPRCDTVHDCSGQKLNGWLRCRRCNMQFSSYPSGAGSREGMNPAEFRAQTRPSGNGNRYQPYDKNLAKLFRRIKFKANVSVGGGDALSNVDHAAIPANGPSEGKESVKPVTRGPKKRENIKIQRWKVKLECETKISLQNRQRENLARLRHRPGLEPQYPPGHIEGVPIDNPFLLLKINQTPEMMRALGYTPALPDSAYWAPVTRRVVRQ